MKANDKSIKNWNPHKYLEHYYTTGEITPDEKRVLEALVDFLEQTRTHFDKVIEFGAGPTVHRAVPLVPYVNKIYMSDYLPLNLKEIKRWINQDNKSYDWDTYIKFVLQRERKSSNQAAIEIRAQNLRKKIKSLI